MPAGGLRGVIERDVGVGWWPTNAVKFGAVPFICCRIPPEQIIGSSIVTEFEMQDGKPVLVRQPKSSLRSKRSNHSVLRAVLT